MLNFPDHEDIQENACFCLQHFVESEEAINRMLHTNCFELLCQCMNKYSNNAELQTSSLELLCVMASVDVAKKSALLSRDIVSRAIQNCLDQAPEPLLSVSIMTLDFLADTEECRRLLLVPQVLQVILDAM